MSFTMMSSSETCLYCTGSVTKAPARSIAPVITDFPRHIPANRLVPFAGNPVGAVIFHGAVSVFVYIRMAKAGKSSAFHG
ncbi:hypothetical protein [Candidatus Methylomicrobium oryzae]|jgi:hypothetical protein|uniref:hypothetical protein n=1 Tax=Candidatus Methylomicrobium oryzae TaxID=2802053 RepID=UPI001923EC13|nr:hypothetical protein [Methylomicrobium sp. RS1]